MPVARTLLLFGIGLFLCAPPAHAQSASIAGSVTDPQGAAVSNAQVILSGTPSGSIETTQTDSAGTYEFSAIEAGSYEVRVLANGFRAATRRVAVGATQSQRADVSLALADRSETVTVTQVLPDNTTTSTGPWGTLVAQDAPYSIEVIPSALVANVQAPSPDQIFKMSPV